MMDGKKYIIYKHTFPNGKVYIGQTSRTVEERWVNGNGYYNQGTIYRAIQKYGWDNIKHEVLFENLTKLEADQKEIELISFYNSTCRDFGYNIDLGGHSIESISETTKLKMSENHADVSGSNNPMYGKKHKQQSIEKMRVKKIGKVYSEETKKKMSESSKGKHHTESSKKKISEKQLGVLNHMYGKTGDLNHSSKAVYQLDLSTGDIINRFGSMTEAERETGVSHTTISACCRGIVKHGGGYMWCKCDEYDNFIYEDCA